MPFFTFLAGFFRESGATESSTRLVGIMSFTAATGLGIYVAIAKTTDATTLGLIAMQYGYGCIALGLRKSSGVDPAKDPDPAVPSPVPGASQ